MFTSLPPLTSQGREAVSPSLFSTLPPLTSQEKEAVSPSLFSTLPPLTSQEREAVSPSLFSTLPPLTSQEREAVSPSLNGPKEEPMIAPHPSSKAGVEGGTEKKIFVEHIISQLGKWKIFHLCEP